VNTISFVILFKGVNGVDEVKRFLELLNSEQTATTFGEVSIRNLESFFENISKASVIQSDRPDIIIESDTVIYGLEYFTFDSSASSKKGTSMRIERAKVQREYDAVIDKAMKNGESETISHRTTYQSSRSIEDYVENYIRNYQAHYIKKETYLENEHLKETKKPVELGFVIENTSILPDIIYGGDKKPNILLPFNLSVLQQFMKDKEHIPHVFYITHNGNNGYSIYYFHIYKELLNDLKNLDFPIYDELNLIDWQAHSMGFTIFIPKSDMEK